MDEFDEPTLYIGEEKEGSQREKPKPAEVTKGLGTWVFDTRNKKRKYISLSGRVLTGSDATHIANIDRESEFHPERSARNDLVYIVETTFDRTLQFARDGFESAKAEHFSLQFWGT